MSNQIRQAVKEIQFKTDFTLDEIAAKLGYSPAYFRNEVSKGKSKAVLETLQTKFNELIEQNVVAEPDKKYELNGHSKAGAESSLSYSQPIQERYISLLEQTLKEKKDELIELKARINDLEGKQRDFLARVEGSIERYEHLVLAQLQSKGQEVPGSTPTVLQQTYKSQGSGQKKNS
jgi:hypothetical protein